MWIAPNSESEKEIESVSRRGGMVQYWWRVKMNAEEIKNDADNGKKPGGGRNDT